MRYSTLEPLELHMGSQKWKKKNLHYEKNKPKKKQNKKNRRWQKQKKKDEGKKEDNIYYIS